jgi:predicted site-specific integrase-resolvase
MNHREQLSSGTAWTGMTDRELRVAAYCRVSTDKEDQVNSLVSQKKYFTEYIRNRQGWLLIDIYCEM